MISVFVSKIAGLILKIPLANLLGGTGMGYYSSAYAVFMPLYALCAASLPPAIAQMVSEDLAFERWDRINRTKRTALVFFGAISLLLTLIPLLFSRFIAERIIGNPEAAMSVSAIAPCVFFGTVTAVYRGYYEGLRNMTPTAVSQMVDSTVKLITGLGLAYLTKEYAMAMYSSGQQVFGHFCVNEYEAIGCALPYISAAAVLGTALSDLAGMAYLVLRKRDPRGCAVRRSDTDLGEQKKILTRLIKLISPIALASLVSSLINTIDLSTIILILKNSLRKHPELYVQKYSAIISGGVELKELPNFLYGSFTGLSMAIFTLAPSLCSVFGKSAFPKIAELKAKGDSSGVSHEIKRAVLMSAYISIPAGFGLAIFSEPILKLLFSSRYAEISVSHLPLSVLSLGTAFLAVSACAYSMLQAIGYAKLPVKITLVGAILKLILNSVFIPIKQSGLTGAALATVISYAVMCIWSIASLYRLTGTAAKPVWSTVVPCLTSAVSCIGAYSVYNYLQTRLSSLLSIGISVLFAVIVYILTVILLDICNKNKITSQIFE